MQLPKEIDLSILVWQELSDAVQEKKAYIQE